MDRELFRRILEQVRGKGRLLHFHVMGEPLLHQELGFFLDMCASFDYRVNIVTNGTLLPAVADCLIGKPALRQVSISLHHLSEHVPSATLDAYFRGIGDFALKAVKSPGLFVSLRLWNRQSGPAQFFRDDISRRIGELFSLSSSSVAHCKPKDPLKLAPNIWLNCAERFEWPNPESPDLGDRGTCLGLREQIAVLVDGTVVPCCLDREGIMALGNVATAALADILSGARAAAMRDGFCKGILTEELCRRCSYRLRFNRQRSCNKPERIKL